MRRVAARPLVLITGCIALAGLSACGFLKGLVGANTVDLEGAEVKSMGVDIRRTQKTICPRESVQMAVFVEAKLKDEELDKKLETWEGRGITVNKNDRLDFADFAFHSELGSFDEAGFFAPNRDLLASASREFELTTAYKRRPDKFTMSMKYKPDYGCITGGGAEGGAGNAGNAGSSGADGKSGSDGGHGGDGGPGSAGGHGSDGDSGPALKVFAAMVKTPFYDRLVAVKIEGPGSDFLLFSPESSITVRALGGPGGSGGSGGRGGRGGNGGSGEPGGDGGKGGPGGPGGNGGSGGRGGEIELVFDGAHPEIERVIQVDVSGGAAGSQGSAGPGGSGGSRGSGRNQAAAGREGPSGSAGSAGSSGQAGAKGSVRKKAGDAATKFAGLEGIEPL